MIFLRNKQKIVILINNLQGGGTERVALSIQESFMEKFTDAKIDIVALDRQLDYSHLSNDNIIFLSDLGANGNIFNKITKVPSQIYSINKLIETNGYTKVICLQIAH